MLAKRLEVYQIAIKRFMMNPLDKQILKSVLRNGISYPGGVMMELGISPTQGTKKINELKKKGYLVKHNQSSLLKINPDKRKAVKILTFGL
jgi:hypothetical protein